ncbi:MAG: hypothetical protein MK132_09825 [Lentisphaerales bacterium]|nr:hypothetical protein [Lentisphaerales bacterium]
MKRCVIFPILLFLGACLSSNEKEYLQIGNKTYRIISNPVVLINRNLVDAAVYWHQRSDDAIIRVTHSNELKKEILYCKSITKTF